MIKITSTLALGTYSLLTDRKRRKKKIIYFTYCASSFEFSNYVSHWLLLTNNIYVYIFS